MRLIIVNILLQRRKLVSVTPETKIVSDLIQCTGIPSIPSDMNQLLFVYPMSVLINGNHCMSRFMRKSICQEKGVNVPQIPSPILRPCAAGGEA